MSGRLLLLFIGMLSLSGPLTGSTNVTRLTQHAEKMKLDSDMGPASSTVEPAPWTLHPATARRRGEARQQEHSLENGEGGTEGWTQGGGSALLELQARSRGLAK